MGTRTRSKSSPVVLENIVDTGTEGTKVAVGTTGQRGTTTGQWRFNTTTGYFEGRSATGISTLEPTPEVTSVDVAEVDSTAGGNVTIVVTGTNFSSGGTIAFVGTSAEFNAASTTHDSVTQQTAVAPKASFLNAQEPYKVKFTSSSGKSGTSASGLINVDSAPTWTTSAGSLGSVAEDATGNHFTLAATDAEGDTVTYSETGATNITGAGLSLNSSTGVISGDPTDVSSDTTINFTGRATAATKTADRSFSFVVQNVITATGGTITTYTYGGIDYKCHTFLYGASGTFVIGGGIVDILMVAGGAGGGGRAGGGGGAGGFIYYSQKSLSSATYSIGVGAGGGGGAANVTGGSGGDTTFTGLTTAVGGGGGKGNGGSAPHAGSGGSGGGGGYTPAPNSTPGTGTTNQGYSGGTGTSPYLGGGGGGASAVGGDGGAAPHGGAGYTTGDTVYNWTAGSGTVTFPINFANGSSSTSYAGGGGGGGHSPFTAQGLGGIGGGGDGGTINTWDDGDAATANTGGGGGGATSVGGGTNSGGAGGTGIVIIRYVV